MSLECGMVALRAERDPEDRVINVDDEDGKREKMFDKTIADSFPASDPPSSVPDPHEDSFYPGADSYR
jgi:hypothetical protein